MCNNYERHIGQSAFASALEAAGLQLPDNTSTVSLEPATEVRVGDTAPVLVAHGNGVTLRGMHWGFPPSKAGRAPVFNFRSEGRRFGESQRCVIPASAFFEFTGTRSPKSKWRFVVAGEPIFGIAGLWREEPDQAHFTMLTVAPGSDIEPFHDRQIVILRPACWADWVYLSKPEGDLLRPLPEGSLKVELARAGIEEHAAGLNALARVKDQAHTA